MKAVNIRRCWVLLPFVLVTRCGSSPQDRSVARHAIAPAGAPHVVARVNGEPVLPAEVAHQLGGVRPVASDLREALKQRIDLELLVQEAMRRGLDRDPGVLSLRRRAIAQLLIRMDFGDSFTQRSVPQALIERAYEMNKSRYVHPELVEVSHVLAMARDTEPAAVHRRAKEVLARVRRRFRRGMTAVEFEGLAADLHDVATTAGIKLEASSLITDRRVTTVAVFADAAFALEQGQISPPVKTKFGYHLIYLKRRIPPVNRSLADVSGEIRERIFEEARKLQFVEYVDGLGQRGQVRLIAEGLEPATGQPGVGADRR